MKKWLNPIPNRVEILGEKTARKRAGNEEGLPAMVYVLLNKCQLVQENTTYILHWYLTPGVSPICFMGAKQYN